MTFDIEKFRGVYPQFEALTDAQLEFMWENALLISGIAEDMRIPEAQKENLLFMLVCHLATLAQRGTAGALTGATEGSVSASFSTLQGKGEDADWYNLTPCGSAYWQFIKRYRLGGLWFKGRKCLR
jgi:hypothetical protein